MNANWILYSSEVYFKATQSDSVKLTRPSRRLYFQAGGDITVKRVDGTSVTITVQAGQQLDIVAAFIMDTGTTIADADILVMC